MEIDRPLPAQRPERSSGEVRDAGIPTEDVASWEGLEKTDEFRRLINARKRFVLPATVFFLAYYFLLPLANGLAPGFMRTDVIGNINIAYLFALSQFVMAWVLAYLYMRQATTVFDRLAAAVRERAARGRGSAS